MCWELLRYTLLAIEELLRLRIQPPLELFYSFIIIETWAQSLVFSVLCLQVVRISLYVANKGLWLSSFALNWWLMILSVSLLSLVRWVHSATASQFRTLGNNYFPCTSQLPCVWHPTVHSLLLKVHSSLSPIRVLEQLRHYSKPGAVYTPPTNNGLLFPGDSTPKSIWESDL